MTDFLTVLGRAGSIYDLKPFMEGEEDYGPCPCFLIKQPGFEADGNCWRVGCPEHPYDSRRSDGRCCVHVVGPNWAGEKLRVLLDDADWYGGWALEFEAAA